MVLRRSGDAVEVVGDDGVGTRRLETDGSLAGAVEILFGVPGGACAGRLHLLRGIAAAERRRASERWAPGS